VAGANPKYECCTFRGAVVALDAATGSVVWSAHTIADAPKPTRTNKIGTQLYGPSGAAVWSAPTIDVKAGVLYVGTGDSYSDPAASTSDAILAFDLETGKLKWSRQITENDAWNIGCVGADPANCPEAKGPDHDFGSSPMLTTGAAGRRVLVVGQKSGAVHGLDPDGGGRVLWSTRVGRGSTLGGIQWGPATDGAVAYVAVSDPSHKPDGGLDPEVGGGLTAVRVSDGKILWKTPAPGCGDRTTHCSPAQSAAVTAMPGIVFSGSVDGHMRAYAAGTGEIVWDVDTARDFETVNHVRAHGGSMDLAGPTVVDGVVLLTSGYGVMGGMTGNVLLAFTSRGK
jgi:polyvinyl alcohol dehydrogenase (cytochrome)